MKKILIPLLLVLSNTVTSSESGKICVSSVTEPNNYQVTLNQSKKYALSELVQICINGASLDNINKIKIYNKKTLVQVLLVNFKGTKNDVACIKQNKTKSKWLSGFAEAAEEHCEFK